VSKLTVLDWEKSRDDITSIRLFYDMKTFFFPSSCFTLVHEYFVGRSFHFSLFVVIVFLFIISYDMSLDFVLRMKQYGSSKTQIDFLLEFWRLASVTLKNTRRLIWSSPVVAYMMAIRGLYSR
jgi:hypothetical protein